MCVVSVCVWLCVCMVVCVRVDSVSERILEGFRLAAESSRVASHHPGYNCEAMKCFFIYSTDVSVWKEP